MSLKVKLWGVRGSLPAPHSPEQIEDKIRHCLVQFQKQRSGSSVDEFLESLPPEEKGGFGGHTICVQVSSPQTSLIIDAGSGIRRLGEQLALGPAGRGQAEIHIMMTHFHWDHLIGLPFFLPLFIKGNKINFYSVQIDLEARIREVFRKPNFPVPFDNLKSEVKFHTLLPRAPVAFGDIKVTPYGLDHPDPCWGFRFESGGKVYAHCVDSETTRVSQNELGADLPLYQNVDLLLFDAQYSFSESTEKINWGHSSAPIGLDLAIREKVKKILFVHHDPSASDSKIAAIREQTNIYFREIEKQMLTEGAGKPELTWEFAREGMQLDL